MSTFIPVAQIPEFPNGSMRKVMADGTAILLARVNGQFYATELLCPHLEADLSEGTISGTTLTCPMHNSQFDLRDGRVLRWTDLTGTVLTYAKKIRPPRSLKCYPVRTEGDTVLVGFL
jgi:3-phenylpropionate/trans-cinnamate dioxygenase ferredoxin subunit